jgi:hypothetical protein
MKDLYELKKMLIDLLNEYSKKRDLSSSSLQMVDMLAHACKNVCKIIEYCEEEEMGGMSQRSMADRSYYGGNRSMYDGGSYDSYYDGGMSHRRGRAANGRFVSRDASDMARRLREMVETAPDENTRREIQRLADKMEEM